MHFDNILPAKATIKYSIEGEVVCSIGKQPFHYRMDITYSPRAWLLEFIEFDNWVTELERIPTTIEGLTASIFQQLWARLHPAELCIETTATTSVHEPVYVVIHERRKE